MTNRTPAADMPHAVAVTITKADNKDLTYPSRGRMQITEVFTDGRVLGAFQRGEYDGSTFYADGGPVSLLRPEFTHVTSLSN